MNPLQKVRFAAVQAFLQAAHTCTLTDFRGNDPIEVNADATRTACRAVCYALGYTSHDLDAIDADFIVTEFGPKPRNPITEADLHPDNWR